jgi:hypothetical protein
MPRWVKLAAFLAAALILLMIAVMVLVGGEHGPDRHTPGSGYSDQQK